MRFSAHGTMSRRLTLRPSKRSSEVASIMCGKGSDTFGSALITSCFSCPCSLHRYWSSERQVRPLQTIPIRQMKRPSRRTWYHPKTSGFPSKDSPAHSGIFSKLSRFFTVAHSITLALASLDIISLPSRLVESIIALSIVLVAVNNIVPTFRDRTWIILFLFGLFHGLGFASVMKNLPFRMPSLTTLLVCFNIGVELGQLVIVAAVFPILFLLRKTSFYKPVVLIGGSVVLIVIAGYWFVERAMGWG